MTPFENENLKSYLIIAKHHYFLKKIYEIKYLGGRQN
jgi:hypothetical protein